MPRRRWPKAITVGGEKCRTDAYGKTPKGLDHDPPPARKWAPLGILMLATGALSLFFATQETSAAWVAALRHWWQQVGPACHGIRRLVIYLDNGPHNSGRRRPFLKGL